MTLKKERFMHFSWGSQLNWTDNGIVICLEILNEDRHCKVVITAFSCICQVELGTNDSMLVFKSRSMTGVWKHLSQGLVNSTSSVDTISTGS